MGWLIPIALGAAIGTQAEMQARREAMAPLEAVLIADLHHLHEGRPMPPVPVPPPMAIRDKFGLKQGVLWALVTGAACGVIAAVLMGVAGIAGGHPGEGVVFGLLIGVGTAVIGTMMPGTIVGLIGQRQRIKANAVANAHNEIREIWAEREVLRQNAAAGVVSPAEAMERIYSVVPHLDPRQHS